MSTDQDYEWVYTGSDVNVQFLQDLLNNAGISSRVRNDFDSGLRAGFGGGLPGQVLLFAEKTQLDEAMKIAKSTFPKDFKDGE